MRRGVQLASVLDQTQAVIEALNRSATPAEVCSSLTAFTSRFGLTAMISGTMPSHRDRGKSQDQHLLAWSYPTSWMGRYLEREYVHIDPVIRRIQSNLSPFVWSDAAPYVLEKDEPIARVMRGEAADHKLTAGVAIPMLTLEGNVAAVSIGGEFVDLPPHALGMISLTSSFAIARAIDLQGNNQRRQKANLTCREVECLKWAADGKTEWEISVILSISEHTADKHLSNARRKLSAANRTQAIASALRLGVIT
jgi:LuxR family transcriptional regulator, quorum-sensing system regulator BjaR1